MTEKPIKHFNLATVWGRVDGVPTSKKSNEGKGKPFWRLKVICASKRGNVFAYGRLWNKEKASALVEYVKKSPGAGIKLVGFFNQYDHDIKDGEGKVTTTVRRSNFTWYEWNQDKCEDPRAAFALVGIVKDIQDDRLMLHLDRQGSEPEDFTVYARDLAELEARKLIAGDVVQVKGYLQTKTGEDEFGCTEESLILPCFDVSDLKVRGDDFA